VLRKKGGAITMKRRSRYAPAVAIAACGLVAMALASVAPVTSAAAAPARPAAPAPAAAASAGSGTLTAGTSPAVTAVAFPTAAAGWLLGVPGSASSGGASTGGAARAQVWHTTNYGASWQVQWAGAGSPLAISATDQAHAWALIACPGHRPSCGRELLGTADGGRHWRLLGTLPAAVNLIQFISGRLGIATSDACLANLALTGCPGRVLVSRDGGAHWTSVLSGPGPVFATAAATGQLWAAQTYPASPQGNQPEPGIRFLTSTDGGRHWTRLGSVRSLGLLSTAVRVTLAATPAGLTWASVFDQLSCAMHGCGVADLLSSGDGGRSWSTVNLADSYPDDCGSDGIAFSAAPDGTALVATGRNGAACAPPYGLMYGYGPAGWQQLPPWQLTQVSSLDAVSEDVAYAISDLGVLDRTTDGGRSWRQLLPAPAPAAQVDVLGQDTAVAAQDQADAGAVLSSANGGRSWSEIADLPGVLTQLDFWSADDAVAATYSPDAASGWQLWRTWNGGTIWAPAGGLPAGAATNVYGPWINAGGQGLLLTVADGAPWEAGSGGVGPVRVWTTDDWGFIWHRGGLLPLGRDSLSGPASFSYVGGSAGWAGWLVVTTASYAQRVAAVTTGGGGLRLLSASLPADNVQFLGHQSGFAWGLEYPAGHPDLTVLTLYRTTDGGATWQHSDTGLVIPASSGAVPLLDFTDASHGWLVLGNDTWRTSDGGRTWSPPKLAALS
jgi:photosystem II stability/assembly factor-like uncharacterized protein